VPRVDRPHFDRLRSESARHFTPNEAVADAYARRYLLYSEINSAMAPLWERIAGQQART
jgi:L-xylulokinase